MGGEHDRPVVGHLIELVDEDRPLGLESLDDIAVMHDLVADIDRPTVALDGALDDVNGALDTGTEAARAGEQDRERLCRLGHEKRSKGEARRSPTRSLAGLRTIA